MKKRVVNRLESYISSELDRIVNDKNLSKDDKLEAFAIYYNTYQFLENYEQNLKVLRKTTSKFKTDNIKEDEER